VTVLVIGASSRVGMDVARGLTARGVVVRAMTRRADASMPEDVGEVVRADLRNPASLLAACAGAQRMFLMSSPVAGQVVLETNAIDAAEATGIEHVVKISNIPIEGLDDGLHGNHRAIERRLDASPVSSTVLQPSFFASVLERQAGLLRHGRFVMPIGRGRIAWIDPRDIAEVAATVLAGEDPPTGACRLTGPEALSATELTRRIARACDRKVTLLRPNRERWHDDLISGGMDPWLADSTFHLYGAIARGALADVSSAVHELLGRPPRPIDDWLTEFLAPSLRAG
jgi:NAD(P)H dehydrogenase (quinone)